MIGLVADTATSVTLGLSERDQFVGAVVDLAGKVLDRRTYPPRSHWRRRRRPRRRDLRRPAQPTPRPVLGVGVAGPGIVAADGTIVTMPTSTGTACSSGTTSPRKGLAVHVANDANAAALAELTFGDGDSTNLILVRVDEGVGVGLVLDGVLFTEARRGGRDRPCRRRPRRRSVRVRRKRLPRDRRVRAAARSATRRGEERTPSTCCATPARHSVRARTVVALSTSATWCCRVRHPSPQRPFVERRCAPSPTERCPRSVTVSSCERARSASTTCCSVPPRS